MNKSTNEICPDIVGLSAQRNGTVNHQLGSSVELITSAIHHGPYATARASQAHPAGTRPHRPLYFNVTAPKKDKTTTVTASPSYITVSYTRPIETETTSTSISTTTDEIVLPTKQQEILEQRREGEEKEYLSGLWIPTLTDTKNLEALQDWNQEWASLGTLEFCRVSKSGLIHASSFPPRGLS